MTLEASRTPRLRQSSLHVVTTLQSLAATVVRPEGYVSDGLILCSVITSHFEGFMEFLVQPIRRLRHSAWFVVFFSSTALALPRAETVATDVIPGPNSAYSVGPTGPSPVTPWWSTMGDSQLNTWIQNGLRDNPSLQSAWERVHMAKGLSNQQRSLLLPSAQLTAGAYKNSTEGLLQQLSWQTGGVVSDELVEFLGEEYETAQWSLVGQWVIDLFGSNTTAWLASRWDAKAADGNRAAQSMATASQIGASYFDWIAAKEILDLVEGQVSAQQALMALSVDSYEGGDSSSLDLLMQKQQLAAVSAVLPGAQASVQQCRGRLALLLGKTISELNPEGLSTDLELPEPPAISGLGLPRDLLARRPDLQAIMAQLESADYRRISAWMSLLPTVSLTASTGEAGQHIGDGDDWQTSGTWAFGVSASLPLFSGGRQFAAARGASAGARAALFDLQAAMLTAIRDVEDAWGTLVQFEAEVLAYEIQVGAAQAAFDEASKLYLAGVLPYLSVLTSQQALQQAQVSRVRSRRNRLAAFVYVHDSLGAPWAFESSRSVPFPSEVSP
jgi:NodT family efflux transporter outer membrane factor (OMF) lipoprotein